MRRGPNLARGPAFAVRCPNQSVLHPGSLYDVTSYSCRHDVTSRRPYCAQVKPEDLRCAIGPLLDAGSGPYDDTEVALTGRGYTVVSLPQTGRAIHVQFPFRTRLSILIAIRRVWPAIGAYLKVRTRLHVPYTQPYGEPQQ